VSALFRFVVGKKEEEEERTSSAIINVPYKKKQKETNANCVLSLI
jgi:hypothetical protein